MQKQRSTNFYKHIFAIGNLPATHFTVLLVATHGRSRANKISPSVYSHFLISPRKMYSYINVVFVPFVQSRKLMKVDTFLLLITVTLRFFFH